MRKNSSFMKKRYFMVALFLMLIAGVSLGYAYLSTTLTINGHTKIAKAKWDIRFTNPQTLRTGSTVEAIDTDGGDYGIRIDNDAATDASWNLTLKQPGDKYVFSIDVENKGTIDGKLDEITADTLATLSTKYGNDLTKVFDYQYTVVTADTNETAVTARNTIGNVLKSGEKFRIIFTLEFKEDIQASDLETIPTDGYTLAMKYQLKYSQSR